METWRLCDGIVVNRILLDDITVLFQQIVFGRVDLVLPAWLLIEVVYLEDSQAAGEPINIV